MLAKGDFVMTHFDFQTHVMQGVHQLGAHPHRFIIGGEIEITADIMRYGVDACRAIALEKEKLGFRTDVIGPTALVRPSPTLASTRRVDRQGKACHPAGRYRKKPAPGALRGVQGSTA